MIHSGQKIVQIRNNLAKSSCHVVARRAFLVIGLQIWKDLQTVWCLHFSSVQRFKKWKRL